MGHAENHRKEGFAGTSPAKGLRRTLRYRAEFVLCGVRFGKCSRARPCLTCFRLWDRHADEVEGVRETAKHIPSSRTAAARPRRVWTTPSARRSVTMPTSSTSQPPAGSWRTLMERALRRGDAVSRVPTAVQATLAMQEATARRSERTRAARRPPAHVTALSLSAKEIER